MENEPLNPKVTGTPEAPEYMGSPLAQLQDAVRGVGKSNGYECDAHTEGEDDGLIVTFTKDGVTKERRFRVERDKWLGPWLREQCFQLDEERKNEQA